MNKMGFAGGLASRMAKANASKNAGKVALAPIELMPIHVPQGATITTFGPTVQDKVRAAPRCRLPETAGLMQWSGQLDRRGAAA